MLRYNGMRRDSKSAGQSDIGTTTEVTPHPHEFEMYFDI